MEYYNERKKTFDWQQIALTYLRHLFRTCDHFVTCWVVKALAAIVAVSVGIFLIRIEMFILSKSEHASWATLIKSMDGVLDNVLLFLVFGTVHAGVAIALSFYVRSRIVMKRRGPRAEVIRLEGEFQGIIALTFVFATFVMIPGFQIRVLLWWLNFGQWIDWEVDFATGRNFALHLIFGMVAVLFQATLFTFLKWFVRDFIQYRKSKTFRVIVA
jgi:hypothetical protein